MTVVGFALCYALVVAAFAATGTALPGPNTWLGAGKVAAAAILVIPILLWLDACVDRYNKRCGRLWRYFPTGFTCQWSGVAAIGAFLLHGLALGRVVRCLFLSGTT